MVAINANMTDSQGWIPLSAADAEALAPGHYMIDSESVTAEGIHELGPVRIGTRMWPYVIDGVWCTRGIAGTTKATHSSGAVLTRYYPDASAPSGVTTGIPALTLGTTNAQGAASTAIATDATILAFDATAPTTQAFGDTAAAGSAGAAARRDHLHGMPAEGVAISALTAVATPATTDLFIVSQGGNSKKLERSQMMADNVLALAGGSDDAALVTAVNALLVAMKAALLMDADPPVAAGYDDLVLATSDLQAYFIFGEPSGTTAIDALAAANGTYENGPTLGVTGPLPADAHTAVTLVAASSHRISVAHASGGSDFAYMFFMKRSGIGVAEMIFDGASADALKINMDASNVIYLSIAGGGNVSPVVVGPSFTDTASWHHIVVTKTGTTFLIYHDGTAITPVTSSDTIAASTGYYVGQSSVGSYPLNASLSRLAAFSRGLTPTEVADFYAQSLVG